jgi:hypothetical protein
MDFYTWHAIFVARMFVVRVLSYNSSWYVLHHLICRCLLLVSHNFD